jgi:hypothetical protein
MLYPQIESPAVLVKTKEWLNNIPLEEAIVCALTHITSSKARSPAFPGICLRLEFSLSAQVRSGNLENTRGAEKKVALSSEEPLRYPGYMSSIEYALYRQ